MRASAFRSLVCLAALSAACGDVASRPGPVGSLGSSGAAPGGPPSPAGSAASAEPPSPRHAIATEPARLAPVRRDGAIGGLERPFALKRLFAAFARLDADQADDDVRIVQFGDSHTAADVQTGAVRRSLQDRFGDGGRGFVAIGRPWSHYVVPGVRVGMSGEWSPDKAKLGPSPKSDGSYGLSGVGLVTRRAGARAWTDIQAKTTRADVAYLEQPGGGSFDVFVDGVRLVRVSTRADRTGSAFRAFDVAEASPHQLEVRSVGDGEVRIFGATLDRTQNGVVVDALGINGARISQPLAWNEEHWSEQLRHRAPSLVVLAYGTNESVDESMPQATYERQLVDLLGRIARAVPTASCLLLGPPDRAIPSKDGKDAGWVTAPKILEIVASQRRVAEAAGCGFYDQLAAMGGEGSIAAWAAEDPPRAQRDRVHLTKEGYQELGSGFASDLLRAYAQWRKDSGLPPASGPTSLRAPASPRSSPSAP